MFECLTELGVTPITTTYARSTVGVQSVVTWFAVRGIATVALAVRRYTGQIQKFDQCFRYARFFDLYYKAHVPATVSFFKF